MLNKNKNMPYFVYVNLSLKNGKIYIGYTGHSVQKRLNEHNSGCNKWARENKPFKNIYYEQYDNLEEALKREKFLKSGKGREFLDRILK